MARRAMTHGELVTGVRNADRRAVARAISLIESRDPEAPAVLQELYPRTGSAFTIGITGPPGVGKSSLIGALISHVRGRGLTVGVISVDPSSPFTRGALLGDRIRLADHFLDSGVFIRSMGARGHLGGLAETTLQAVLLLDAAGFDVVFLETVGAGQSEVEVMGVADEVLLVLMPGSGDSIQALKAGIMEIPDVIAINKMDQPGAKAVQNDIRAVIALDPEAAWRPSIVLTDALRTEGIATLWDALVAQRDTLEASGELLRRRNGNLVADVVAGATARVRDEIERAITGDVELAELIAAVQRREVDPLTAAERVAASVLQKATP